MSTFEVRDPEAEQKLREIGRMLKKTMPKGYGFTLLLFEFGKGGNLFYISSGERADVIKTMEEFIEKNKN